MVSPAVFRLINAYKSTGVLHDMARRHLFGFTLIELLVVISIIALLVGILLPALGSARRSAQALVSLSNVRQWGVANSAFTTEHDGLIAKDGVDTTGKNFVDDEWWPNALAPYVGYPPYAEMENTPLPGDGTIFVDDSAEISEDVIANNGYFTFFYPDKATFYFNYVMSSKLTDSLPGADLDTGDPSKLVRINESQIRNTSRTVMMLEMRSINSEISEDDPFYDGKSNHLARSKANWKRVANRHSNGGHYLFADGHGARVEYEVATTNKQGTRNPDEPNGDWNTDALTWNPLGPALD